MKQIVTLTTDFGLQDSYVAEMKAVLLRMDIHLVDITHQVPAFSIAAGAFQILRAYQHFPKATVHLVVVDPGVGTERKALCVEAGGHLFVGPDNGVLKWAVESASKGDRFRAWEIPLPPRLAPTFHGRDVFAPFIVELIRGKRKELVTVEALSGASFPEAQKTPGGWSAQVLSIDHYGNIVTSLSLSQCARPRLVLPCPAVVRESYQAINDTEVALVAASHGYWEIAVREGSAWELLQIGIGGRVEFIG